ncbi:LpqN/LpqT family lipoprotein [Mycolicibacterium hippocampi]|uniref:Lipoprotein LpqN n=1 Tax=Mycolicibacterium hippocampi TaxID=659824 RepID=A0A7I9ZWD3_9MYCO|nr:LpqN/LpqT family lipoprotein [Mycolicibacterium hippocampi]GFH05322.1 hypothetical protein MHIP_58050 [Mycolicibacterium hippocampi]
MKLSAVARAAAIAATLAVVATGCGSDTTAGSGTTASETTASETTASEATSATAAPTTGRTAPREEDPRGPNPTIADYIVANNIQETPVSPGDPGAPVITLPSPDGWRDAGPDTPEWAYGAIVYTGPEAREYTPSIVAVVSRLTGNVDPQEILDLAAGELNNLPGWDPMSTGRSSTLAGFPAFHLGGTWEQDGVTKVVGQKTAVIEGGDGLYVLQLNADGLESQMEFVGDATGDVDRGITITP